MEVNWRRASSNSGGLGGYGRGGAGVRAPWQMSFYLPLDDAGGQYLPHPLEVLGSASVLQKGTTSARRPNRYSGLAFGPGAARELDFPRIIQAKEVQS